MKLHIKGGRLIDPARGKDETGDVFVDGGTVVEEHPGEGTSAIEAGGFWVTPGLIDAHVHLREPGQSRKETIETGLAAAAAGGFTAVMPMPNTDPPIDSPELVRWLIERGRELGGTRIYPVPAITVGRGGTEVVDMAALKAAGAVAFSDDGSGVADDEVMRLALERAAPLGLVLAQHSEDPTVNRGGVVHDGIIARELGLKGWPVEAEEGMIARDIELVRQTGGRLHVSHISTAGAVRLVRDAKTEGLRVTAEVTPHHLHLTDDLLEKLSTVHKVNPPLRPREHVEACVEALADGTVDIVATDHAPHTALDKEGGFEEAAFGMVGLEIAVGALLILVEAGRLSPSRMIDAMSTRPAGIFGLPGGTLAPGSPADMTLIDPAAPHDVDSSSFRSKGRNTPFDGARFPGSAVMTIVAGSIAYDGR